MADSVLMLSSSELVQNCTYLANKMRKDKGEMFLSDAIFKSAMNIGLIINKGGFSKDGDLDKLDLKKIIETCSELEYMLETAKNLGYATESKCSTIIETVGFIRKRSKMMLEA